MNNRVLKYVLGLALMSGALLQAGIQRPIGKQSKDGVRALNEHSSSVRSAKEVERIKRAQAATTEELDLQGAASSHSSDDARLVSTKPTAPVPTDSIPSTTYGQGAAAYQTAILAALNEPGHAGTINIATAGASAHAAAVAVQIITDAAATAVPAAADKATKVLYDTIYKILHDAVVADDAQKATVLAAVGVAAADVPTQKALAAAGISEALVKGIIQDTTDAAQVPILGAPPAFVGGIHEDVTTAAAAFGIQFANGAWSVKRNLNLAVIPGTADVLHFHEGDFHPDAGFFIGLDATGNYGALTAENKAYALSRVDLTNNGYSVPPVTPIAPVTVVLNAKAGQTANPIHGKGLTHLLLGANQQPVVVTADDQTHVNLVTDINGGTTVLTNKKRDDLTDWPLKDAAGGALPATAKIFDIAATLKPTEYAVTGHLTKNLIFAAVAEKPDLGPTGAAAAADSTKTGIALLSVENDFLSPRDTANTNNAAVAGGTAAHLSLVHGDAVLAFQNDAEFANAGDINLWYDDRYRQVFGTVAGLKPNNNNHDVACGLFHGMWGNNDKFVIKPMLDVTAANKIQAGTEQKVAASIFGAQVTNNWADAATGSPVIDLYRPRTMHTSTDKDYLLVSGGVGTKNYKASRAWVNALPLVPPAPLAADPYGHNEGDLAKITDFAAPIAAAADAPRVNRVDAKANVFDDFTPFIVGRFPSYLAPVAGGVLDANKPIDKTYVLQANALLAGDSVIKGDAANLANLQGDIKIQAAAGAAPGHVTLQDGMTIAPAVELRAEVTFNKNLALGLGTKIGAQSSFVATTFDGADLQVNTNALQAPVGTRLAAQTQLKATNLANPQVLGVVGGLVTNFNQNSDVKGGTIFLSGSVIKQNNKPLSVGAGGVVRFDAAQDNEISKQSVTNIKMKAEQKPAGLHLAEENVANTAIELLKLEAAKFAAVPGFAVGMAAGVVGNEFTGVANNYLGAAGNNDGKNALIPVATGNAAGQALAGAPANGKTALKNLATAIAAEYVGHPSLSHGFAVADAMMTSVNNNDTSDVVYTAGRTKAIDLTGAVDNAAANSVLDYSLKLAAVAANALKPEVLLDGGLRSAMAQKRANAGAQAMLEVGARATRNAVVRDVMNVDLANALPKNQAVAYAACLVLNDPANAAEKALFDAVAGNALALAAINAAFGVAATDAVMNAANTAALAVALPAAGQPVALAAADHAAPGVIDALLANPLARALLAMVSGDDTRIKTLMAATGVAAGIAPLAAVGGGLDAVVAHLKAIAEYPQALLVVNDLAGNVPAITALATVANQAPALAALATAAPLGAVNAAMQGVIDAVKGNSAALQAIQVAYVALAAQIASVTLVANIDGDAAALHALTMTGSAAAAKALLGGGANVVLDNVIGDAHLLAAPFLDAVNAAAPNNPEAMLAAVVFCRAVVAAAQDPTPMLAAIAGNPQALAALEAIAINPATTGHLLPFIFAIEPLAPGPVAAAAKAGLIALAANGDALAAMAMLGGDVHAVVLAAVAAAGGANNADQGQAVFEAALNEVLAHNATFAPEEKLILSLSASAVAQPVGGQQEQRQMIANGITAAYAGDPSAFAQTWSNPDVLGAHGFMENGAMSYVNKAAAFIDQFKKNIVGGYQGANALTDAEKLSRIYDEGAAPVGNDKIASKLKAMVDKSLDGAYYPNDKTMLALQSLIGDYTAGGEGFQHDGNGWKNAKMAQAAAQKYVAMRAAVGPLTQHEKYLQKLADGAQKVYMQTAGLDNLVYADYSDPAKFNDSGFALLNAVSDKLNTSKNQAGAVVPVADMKNHIPEIAYTALSALPAAGVNFAGAPGSEFLAGRAGIDFAPDADFVVPAGTLIGSGSQLSGVTVGGNDVWQFGAGVTLPVGTTLPMWTLFKKGANTDYNPGGNVLTGAPAAALAVGAPWGGQWVLGDVPTLGAAGRNKLTVATADLQLKSVDDGIKIAANRKIQSNNGAAVANAWEKYTLTLPAGTLLPAGTKVYNAAGGALLNAAVGTNGLDFATTNLPPNADVTFADDSVVGGPWDVPAGITIEFPAYPTKLAAGVVLPAGTRIANTKGADNDQHAAFQIGGVDVAGLTFTHPAHAFYTLPADGVVVNPITLDDVAVKLGIDHDPLFTSGIVRGSFNPVSKLTQQYKPNVALTLAKWTPQRFAPGTVLPMDAVLEPATIHPAATGEEMFVASDMVGYGVPGGTLSKGSELAPATAFTEQEVKVGPGVDKFELTGKWHLSQNLVLPAGTTISMLNGFNEDWTAKIQGLAADGLVTHNLANFNQAVPVADGAGFLAVAANDPTHIAGGYKVMNAAGVDINAAATSGLKIEVPAAGVIKGADWNVGAGNLPKLTANLEFKSDTAAGNYNNVDIKKGSVLGVGSNIPTGIKVLKTAALPDFPARYAGDVLGNLKTVGGAGVLGADRLKITNGAGDVTVLSGGSHLELTAAGGVTGKYAQVTVGAEKLVTAGGDNLLVPAAGLTVGGGSTLAANTFFDEVTLGGPLTVATGPENIAATSIIKRGSTIANGTQVAVGADLEVVGVPADLLKFGLDNAVKCKDTVLAGATKADGDTVFTIPNDPLAPVLGIFVPNPTVWNLPPDKAITLDAKAQVFVDVGGQLTLGKGSVIEVGSNIVTTESGYAVSATDMQVVGDTVYIALEGDRDQANGIEAGVFKSTALFNTEGAVRGWTPWQRVGANEDAAAFFGYNPNTSNLVYLTSPNGKAFVDNATGTLVNPATTVKMTQWGSGDNATGGNSLHDGMSLAGKLASIFGSTGGVYGLFDFDPDTYAFKNANRRYQDPYVSFMVATGVDTVAVIVSGKHDGTNFTATKKFDNNTVKAFTQGLAGMGRITCAEFTRNNAASNWLFVGGENGLAVLAKTADGDGFAAHVEDLTWFNDCAFHKVFDEAGNPFTSVRRIIADEATGYVYVLAKDRVVRINPREAAFKVAVIPVGDGKLVHGDLTAGGKTYVKIATAALSNAYDKGTDGNAIGGGNAGSLLYKGITATQPGEFTDMAILSSLDNAPLTTKLALATTNGLFADAVGLDNNFDGINASVYAERWKKIATSAKQPAPYDAQDINARAGVTAAAAVANMDDLADAVTTIIGAVAGCAIDATPDEGLAVPAGEYNDVLAKAKQAAIGAGAPAALVNLVTNGEISQIRATAIWAAVKADAAMLADMRTVIPTAAAPKPEFADYDRQTKLSAMVATVAADIQVNGIAAAHHYVAVMNAAAGGPGDVQNARNDVRALVAGALNAAVRNTVAQQIAENQGLYGDDVAWLDKVAVDAVAATGAGLKTVLRIEPVNLHSGGRMAVQVANTHSFEGNLNVYATDNSNSELRLYRLDATGGTVKGIVEATSKDINDKELPYVARLGTVNPDLITDLDSNFFLKSIEASRVDDMIASGGVPALIDPRLMVPAAAADTMLDVGGEYLSSLSVPQLSAAFNTASGAQYVPTNDGARVTE